MKTSVLEWVNSSGGPLVCGDKEAVSDWKGTAGFSGSKFGQKGTDYQSSCLVNDYVGHMDGYGNSIVVLGDEPLQTAFFHTFTEDLAIARWIYADPSVDINKELRSFTESDSLQPAVTLEIASGSIVIFDASVEFKNCSSSIIEGINPGLYKLTSEKFQIGRKYSFLIHRILPAA